MFPLIPYLPDIHPLVDSTYRPYDIGQVGQLDVHILTGLFGGDSAARDLTPAWDGGIYWAGQRSAPRLRRSRPAPSRSRFSTCPSGRTRRPHRPSPTCIPTNWAANTPASSPTKPHAKASDEAGWNRGTGLQHRRRTGCYHPARQAGVCLRKFRPAPGPQTCLSHSWMRKAADRSSPPPQADLGAFRSTIPGRQCRSAARP